MHHPEEVLEEILQDVNPAPVLRFREAGANPEELRYASWYAEMDGEREQWALMPTPSERAPTFKRSF
jgi:hypothetical protein